MKLLMHMSDLAAWGKEIMKANAKVTVLQHKAQVIKAMQAAGGP